MNPPARLNRITALLLHAAALIGCLFAFTPTTEARLDPFYIVHGSSYGKLTPRVLFVVDSSATMRYQQPWPDVGCDWGECEAWGPDQSRVHGARAVINKVTADANDEADFALMTFGQVGSPASASTVPHKCYSKNGNDSFRFHWVTSSDAPSYVKKIGGKWQLVRKTSGITNAFGGTGTWMLCGDNRLFPYLRHDDLGSFSLPNNANAPLPDAPLYTIDGDESGFTDGAANKYRKVQWFPRYLGLRGNLDCGDVNEHAIAHGSYGDYGTTNSARSTHVCGHDFYYWPYVDGFPGYSWHTVSGPSSVWEEQCDDGSSCGWKYGSDHRGGVSRRDENRGASLFAPFYSESVLAANDIPPEDKGPLTQHDAELIFDGMTSKAYQGGVDVSGNKPFEQVVGDLDDYLDFPGNVPEPSDSLVKSNAALSHDTVASYLSFVSTVTDEDVCRPMAVIFLTDAMPEGYKPQTATGLHQKVRKFRAKLGVKTYVVGFSNEWWNNGTAWDGLNLMACAAAGANNVHIPCGGNNDYDYDTCRDPEDPKNDCAYRVSTADELEEVLNDILDQIIDAAVPSGAPTVANDFVSTGDPDASSATQTSLDAWTRSTTWEGHVTRSACTDEDPDNPGQLAEYCENAATLPMDTDEVETYGPCPLGRIWDAGECLEQTDWKVRRIYTQGFDNQVFRISDDAGKLTGAFFDLVGQVDALGMLDPPLSDKAAERKKEIEAMGEWLLGRDMPNDWKLPGIANSAPILIRRVPAHDSQFQPSVGIRDPHCAGRRNALGDDIPDSLVDFSKEAWTVTSGGGLADHHDYTEAVLIGDDFGVLHGFHYDSGNELFGFVPLALINNARLLSINGPNKFGQPEELSAHIYGIAATVNAGWAYDADAERWRHLAVFGLGPGGTEIMTVDVSHMGRLQEDDPIEVLWSTTTAGNAIEYAETLGETWSRPALTYGVPNHEMSVEPTSYLVFGSGYREGVGAVERGRTVWVVDALTGETVTDRAFIQPPPAGTTYDDLDDITSVTDVAVGSHCLSRYWGEMQEAYWTDPAGRLFRWDVATEVSDVTNFPHVADSGSTWPTNADGFAVAQPAFQFPACQGTDDFSCSVNPIGAGGNKGDVFTFSPAVAAKNRIDAINDPGTLLPIAERDQFLIAMASGNPNDDAIDSGKKHADFHSSLYLLADDHRADANGGLDIPANAPITEVGAHAHFMRIPLNHVTRTRTIVYPDGTSEEETREFSRKARPLRPPLIRVTGLADGESQLDAEVFYVTYTIYEPANSICDPRWYDADSGEWIADPGATYELSFRLVLGGGDPIDFLNGFALPGDPGDGFGAGGALAGPVVEQQICDGGNCGAVLPAPDSTPCDPNSVEPPTSSVTTIQTSVAELDGFSPLEIPL